MHAVVCCSFAKQVDIFCREFHNNEIHLYVKNEHFEQLIIQITAVSKEVDGIMHTFR